MGSGKDHIYVSEITKRRCDPMHLISEYLVLLSLAAGVGILTNVIGIGGGVILMLVFLFVLKINVVVAGGLSLLSILAGTAIGSVISRKQGAIDTRIFFTLVVFSGLGSVAGSLASYYISLASFGILLGCVTFTTGTVSFLYTRIEARRNAGKAYLDESFIQKDEAEVVTVHRPALMDAISVMAGVVSGLFGIGIGGIAGTYLTAGEHLHPKLAFSTIVAAMIVITSIGAVMHFLKPGTSLSDISLAIPLVAGEVIGAVTGSYISNRMKFVRLRALQGYIIIFLSLLMIAASVFSTF